MNKKKAKKVTTTKRKNATPSTSSRVSVTVQRPSGPPNWNTFLSSADLAENSLPVAPVSHFKHAPLADIWDRLVLKATGAYIELPNPYVRTRDKDTQVLWVGKVIQFVGYKAQVELETFGRGPRHRAWISFCSSVPKPIGFSLQNNILLHPPLGTAKLFPKYVEKLWQEVLKSARTIPDKHYSFLKKKMTKLQERYPLHSKVEALDRTCLSRVRRATVTGKVGDLVHVTYDTTTDEAGGFVFNIHSDAIHPIGWAKAFGIGILDPVRSSAPFPDELIAELLVQFPENLTLRVGQLLEARHPLDVYAICTAVVDKVMQHGYFRVAFRTSAKEYKTPLRYTFHVTSPYIFPIGFCKRNGIEIWKSFRKDTGPPAPLDLLPAKPPHKFTVGLKCEAVDTNDPCYMGPVTIIKVAEHLLQLQYDGWPLSDPTTFTWVSADSPNIAPLGYAELIGFKFQE